MCCCVDRRNNKRKADAEKEMGVKAILSDFMLVGFVEIKCEECNYNSYTYFLLFILLDTNIDASRYILIVYTFILVASNMNRKKYLY
jgi:hypothetical protein